MKNFCKILELPKHDLLVTRSVTKKDGNRLILRFHDDGYEFEHALHYDTEERLDKFYDGFDVGVAQAYFNKLTILGKENDKTLIQG